MRTFATLKNFSSCEGLDIIVSNLNRLLNIVLVDMDIENSTITFLHTSKAALDRAKRELNCIGFPITQLQIQKNNKTTINIPRRMV